MHRRFLLASSAAAALLAASCQNGAAPGPTFATVEGYAEATQTLLAGQNGKPGLLATLATVAPKLFTPAQLAGVQNELVQSAADLALLRQTTAPPAQGTILQTVETYFNDAVALLADVSSVNPMLAPYLPAIDAAVFAIQLIEQYINSLVAAAPPAGAPPVPAFHLVTRNDTQRAHILNMRISAANRGMTAAKAAQILGVKP